MSQPPVCQVLDLKAAAIRTFVRIAQAWRLSEDEQSQILTLSELPRSDEDVNRMVDDTVLLRIGNAISIYGALHSLFPDAAQADTWIHRANSAPRFGGDPAIRLMCSGSARALETVRDHLEAQLR